MDFPYENYSTLFSILSSNYFNLNSFSADAFASSSGGTLISATSNDNVLVNVMCNALKIVTGNAGKAFVAFAIISIGIGFFTGKSFLGFDDWCCRWYCCYVYAPTIVAAITGEAAFDCGN